MCTTGAWSDLFFGSNNKFRIKTFLGILWSHLTSRALAVSRLTGPELDTFNMWRMMPGWAAVTEAFHRGKHHPTSPYKILNAFYVADIVSVLPRGSAGVLTLPASISLAATLRKLVWPFLPLESKGTCQPGRHSSGPRTGLGEQQQYDPLLEKLRCKSLCEMVPWLLHIVLVLDCVLALLTRESSCSNTTDSRIAELGTHIASLVTMHSGRHVAAAVSTLAFLVHQLQAVTLVTVVQACLWRLEGQAIPNFEAEGANWYPKFLKASKKIKSSQLKAIMMSLLPASAISSSKSLSEVCLEWERYAVTHFNGRLLPGCCNLECTNLDGVSEAALKTQLCSGCRRARYCSGACQREAWLVGGHKSVCRS